MFICSVWRESSEGMSTVSSSREPAFASQILCRWLQFTVSTVPRDLMSSQAFWGTAHIWYTSKQAGKTQNTYTIKVEKIFKVCLHSYVICQVTLDANE